MSIDPRFSSFGDVLQQRASVTPDRLAYLFLEDGETEGARLTFGELDARARAIAATLVAQGGAAERALLLFPPGLDFIAAFFGCLYAGVVAIPSYPPSPPRAGRGQPRLRAIVEDSDPRFVLTCSALLPRLEALEGELPGLAQAVRLATDALPTAAGAAGDWREPGLSRQSLAFLQYTSGSTADPKGVMVSHGNLLHNQEVIRRACAHDERSTFVSWLPMYHDMGLIGGVLQSLYTGASCVLMAPVAFLQRPVRWLRAITRYGGHTSGAPDFAYDLCVHKIGAEQRSGLDLASWRVAFDGAEPVRARTLAVFAEAFAPSGFRPEAFFPCYGLAEATLIVSGRSRRTPPTVLPFSGLDEDRAVPAAADEPAARRLVGCGPAGDELEIAIADPAALTERGAGEIGEIWVAGPSVAQGYWGRPELSEATFRARLAGRDGGFLRTGDLGFVHGGELFVTGRLKDLIVVRGRNLYPQDLELTAAGSHDALRRGAGAAFAVETGEGEGIALVLEADARRRFDAGEVLAAVRQAIAEEHEVPVQAVVLVGPGGVPKTTSGKVQRQLCRRRFLDGELRPVAEWRAGPAPRPAPDSPLDLASGALEPLAAWLRRRAAARLGIGEEEIDPGLPLTRYGLDSLAAVELAHDVETELGVELPLAVLLASPGLTDLAARLEAAREKKAEPAPAREGALADDALTPGERALWFLQQLDGASPAYNLAGAARLRGEVDEEVLRRSFAALIARHPALRTTFAVRDGEPSRQVAAENDGELDLVTVDATAWSPGEMSLALEAEVFRPFDLERGPLLRLRLFRRAAGERVLLLVLHHLVADFWSLALLLRELAHGPAGGEAGGRAAPAEEIPVSVWEGWQARLEGFPAVLDLPSDHPRPAYPSHRAGAFSFGLAPETAARLRTLSRHHGGTLFMVLLAVFQSFLHRITGRERLLAGAPMSGRGRAAAAGRVGYFVDMTVLASAAEGDPSFREMLAAARRTVLAAFEHPVPFAALVERLQPERDPARPPLVQVAFALQKAPRREQEGLASFVLNEAGPPLHLPGAAGLTLEPMPLRRLPAQFDLTLHAAEIGGEIRASLHWADDLLDAATAARWGGWIQNLAAALAAAPEPSVWDAPLWSAAERWQVLGEWNDTAAPAAPQPVHERFAARALAAPEAPALRQGTRVWTYGELARRAWGLAAHLRSLGAGPEERVAVLGERRPETIAAYLAVLAAGGVYLPIDPASPPERVAWLVRDAGVRLLLAEPELARRLPPLTAATTVTVLLDGATAALDAPTPPAVAVEPGNLAYVIHTSGSTGEPKGVAVTHGALCGLIDWHLGELGVTPADVASHVAGLGFDAAVWEIWPYLAAGASLVLPPDEATREEPERLRDWLLASGVTLGFVPTPLLEGLLELDWPPERGPRRLLTGGDRLRVRPAAGLPFRLRNDYGPTEATVVATSGEVAPEPSAEVPSIGRPIAGTRVHLLDSRLLPVPLGVPGELCLAGGLLARGYLGRPGQTAERFIPDGLGPPGSRLYRTGDLARFRPDGRLEFLGRTDHQVKVRGVRVEPGEIERALASHPEVREARVLAVESPGGTCLAAFVVASGEAAPAAGALRDHLAAALPPSFIPSLFLPVAALPLTRNGKVDRRALAALADRALADERRREGEAPRDAVEELIAGVWAEVLELPRVGIHDDFFALGGHSLLATQVVSRLRLPLGVELPVRALFETPTVAGLAGRAAAARRAAAGTAGNTGETEPPLLPVPRDGGGLPLSFAQQRLWFLHQLDPQAAAYHVAGALHLTGRLDSMALERALGAVAGRHEALRSTFAVVGEEPLQRIAPAAGLRLGHLDLCALPEAARAAEAEQLEVTLGRLPFDLSRGPLLRAVLVRLGAGESSLLVALHHIVADGWSLGVLLRELAVFYRAFAAGGEPEPLPALPVQVADFAVWQRAWMRGEVLRSRLDWWREQLAGAPPNLRLPGDRPAPPPRSPLHGETLRFRLAAELAAAVETAARRHGATAFMVLLAAWKALLRRYTGEDDLSVGSPVAQRNRVETEGLIGCFVNTLVLRTRLRGEEEFAGLLGRVREVALGAYEHQDLPFELLVEALRPDRDLGATPLFQVLFVLQNAPRPPLELPGLALALRPVDLGAPKLDLVLSLEREGEELAAALDYPRELFDAPTIERLAGHFAALLAGALARPGSPVDRLPLLSPAEQAQLVEDWNPRLPAAAEDGALLHERFSAWAARAPEMPAVAWGGASLSYGELEREANRLAHHLRALGVVPGDRVGLCLEASGELVTGILGALKAGAAWVPLDPAQPLERLAFIAADAGIAALVTVERLAAALGALTGGLTGGLPGGLAEPVTRVLLDTDSAALGACPATPPDLRLPASAPAYVLFTSGSTGRPKGVVCHHAGALNLIDAFASLAPVPARSGASLVCSPSFDVAVWEIFAPLTTGGRLEIAPERVRAEGGALARWLAGQDVASAYVPPSLLPDFAAALETLSGTLPPLARLLVGVEPIPEALLAAITGRWPGLQVLNGYGPTETTICATVYPLPGRPAAERITPIGRAVGGTRVYLLSPGLEPAPRGVTGEIHVGGAGVAQGYLNRPALTAERFLPDPLAAEAGARMYRTGDLARSLAGGDLAFLGRADNQLKIRGVRVEPGEIEAALRECPGVGAALVAPRPGPRGEPVLVAWLAGEPAVEPRRHLRARLPEVMVPAAYVCLAALPVTAHGKVDRAALPDPDWQRPELRGERRLSRTPVEMALANLWQDLLGVEEVGVEESFFDLGGHSLMAGQLIVRVRDLFGVELPVRAVFEAPTVAAMAVAVGRKLVEGADPDLLRQVLAEI